jgi:hypothetical protein
MWNKSYLIFILNNYRYDNYLNSNRYNKLNNYRYDNLLNFSRYNELNVSEGHLCNFLQALMTHIIPYDVRFFNMIINLFIPTIHEILPLT